MPGRTKEDTRPHVHIAAPAKLLTATVASWQSDRSRVQNFRDQRRRRFRFRDGEKAEPAPARTSRSPGGEMDDSWRVTCSVNFSPLPSYPIWSCPGQEWSGHLLICIICLACAAQVALGLGQDLALRIDFGWMDRSVRRVWGQQDAYSLLLGG